MCDKKNEKQTMNAGQAVINREAGLGQYEGDEKIYADVVKNFAENNQYTYGKLKDAIDAGDGKLSYRTAHSLRGAAGAIGAARLADAAFAVEKILLPMNSAGFGFTAGETLNGLMISLETEFHAVFEEIGGFVEKREEIEWRPGVMDREKTIRWMDALAPFLKTGDTRCLEYLDEIKEVLRPAADGFMLFITQIEQYDFEQAYETMESIRRFMMA